jgi:hypothetical protein
MTERDAMHSLNLLWQLLICHAICDYALQNDFVAKGKNFRTPIVGTPWVYPMAAHCLIHAGGVWLVTGNIWLSLAEAVFHVLVDWGKCAGLYGFHRDQMMHAWSKFVWVWGVMR